MQTPHSLSLQIIYNDNGLSSTLGTHSGLSAKLTASLQNESLTTVASGPFWQLRYICEMFILRFKVHTAVDKF